MPPVQLDPGSEEPRKNRPNAPSADQAPKRPAPGDDSEGFFGSITPLRLIRVLLRKWFTIALCIGFAVAIAFFYLWRAPRLYRATSLIEMTQRRPRGASAATDCSNPDSSASSSRLT